MNTTVRRGIGIGLLGLLAACGSSGPTAPTQPPPPSTLATWTPPVTYFPPPSGPSRTFIFDRELSGWVNDYTRASRFVLYENGAFERKTFGDVSEGAYQDADGIIGFLFAGRPGEPRIGNPGEDATGTLQGDSLTVQYTQVQPEDGFQDAVYVLIP